MSRAQHHLLAGPLTLVVMASLLAIGNAGADDPIPRPLERKINMMDRVIDDLLHESPNWLISGSSPCNSLYLEGYGVLFAFEASLVNRGSNYLSGLFDGRRGDFLDLSGIRVEEEDGRIIVYRPEDDDEGYVIGMDPDDEEYDEEDEDEDEEEELEEAIDKLRDRRKRRDEQRYQHGKDELVEVLVDYGETLTELPNSEVVAIAAFLDDDSFFRRKKISRLVLKARVPDLREYGEGKITFDEMSKRVVTEEY